MTPSTDAEEFHIKFVERMIDEMQEATTLIALYNRNAFADGFITGVLSSGLSESVLNLRDKAYRIFKERERTIKQSCPDFTTAYWLGMEMKEE